MDLLAHLAAFVAVADEANFSRAADRLAIAQPLLSRRVKTLEDHFGGPLFDRSPRRVAVTEFGRLLLPYAHDVLERAQRLRHVARSARESAARSVGVPADCDPAALARVIRAGAEHEVTLSVRELAPDAREAGVADGSLAYAVVRVGPESAALRVPLGLASGTDGPGQRPDDREPGAATGRGRGRGAGARRALHLDDLRPRRGSSRPLPVLTMAEDDLPYVRDRLARAAARAGLPENRFRPAGSAAAALAETLAGRAFLLCPAAFAHRHGAAWVPLADATLHRGYTLATAHRDGVPPWLVAPLAAAIGAARAVSTAVESPTRLAARG